ncbi:MAG: NTP transferase domain-containing protein [Bacteroides sp.]|nr:NTP transferase domain-containing protein [Bacteroides sp.]
MDKHLISPSATLREALRALNNLSGMAMTLLVVDPDRHLLGSLTDGDVRRALIAGLNLDSPVAEAMHRDFRALADDMTPMDIRRVRAQGIRLLPVIDSEGRVVRILDLFRQSTRLPLRAMLMAGGRGERLRPLTDTTPKPLLPVGGQPIIDRNIDALRRVGVDDITVSVNYLAEQIEAHFAGSDVKCVRESAPLGTIGACSLLPADGPATTLLMNSDLLTNISFEDFFIHHSENQNDITIATIPHVVSIPFAVLTTDGDRVTGIEEKPTLTHYANAGIYLIRSSLLRNLKPERLDAPDFIAGQIRSGARVGHFPISGFWLDIGTPADFRQAADLIKLTTP